MTKYIYIELDLPVIHGCFNEPKDNEFAEYRKIIHNFSHEPTDLELENFIQTNYPRIDQVSIKLAKIEEFRRYREDVLRKYDILRQSSLAGDLHPITLQVYSPLTTEEKMWRVNMLNFTDLITHTTTEEDYPKLPNRLK